MDDEVRKALGALFTGDDGIIQIPVTPKGASTIETNTKDKRVFTGKFEIYGHTLNLLRQLYDDAIVIDSLRLDKDAAFDAAKKAADAKVFAEDN